MQKHSPGFSQHRFVDYTFETKAIYIRKSEEWFLRLVSFEKGIFWGFGPRAKIIKICCFHCLAWETLHHKFFITISFLHFDIFRKYKTNTSINSLFLWLIWKIPKGLTPLVVTIYQTIISVTINNSLEPVQCKSHSLSYLFPKNVNATRLIPENVFNISRSVINFKSSKSQCSLTVTEKIFNILKKCV